jgi:hypothetical protein
MERQYVSFEVSKLLKDKYPLIPQVYNEKGEAKTISVIMREITENKNVYYPRPEIWQVVEWFIEKGILIIVNISIDDTWYFELYNLKDKRNVEISTPDNYYNSRQEAYNAAFKHILEELI